MYSDCIPPVQPRQRAGFPGLAQTSRGWSVRKRAALRGILRTIRILRRIDTVRPGKFEAIAEHCHFCCSDEEYHYVATNLPFHATYSEIPVSSFPSVETDQNCRNPEILEYLSFTARGGLANSTKIERVRWAQRCSHSDV